MKKNKPTIKRVLFILLIASIYYFGITSLILVLSSSNKTSANYPSNDYNLPKDWSNFEMVDELPNDSSQLILIVSNRPFLEDAKNGIILPNKISEYRKVTYLLAFFNGENWKLKKIQDLSTGLDIINKGESITLFVHGHGKSFIRALNRTYRIKKRYNKTFILFDWPSRNSNFNKSLKRVRRCGENFYNLILELEDYKNIHFKQDQKLNMLCHSLGNYFISHLVVNGNNQYLNRIIFDNLILNAAAIKAKKHDEVLEQIHFAKNMYIMSNENDKVLRGANLIMSGKMLGNFILRPLAKNFNYIDFTEVAEMEHTYYIGYHEFEYSNPLFFNIYNSLLLGEQVNTNILTKGSEKNMFIAKPLH